MRIVLGFDFYGAGNIGDDLMVAGFMGALADLAPGSGVLGTTPRDIESQRARFPGIAWVRPEELAERLGEEARAGALWAGVGGTPFQLSSGLWFLNFLRRQRAVLEQFEQRVMVNIAAQDESLARAADFAPIAGAMTRIAARDPDSARLLVEHLGVAPGRVRLAADLAHVALAELKGAARPAPEFDLGVMLAGESLGPQDVGAARDFVRSFPGSGAFVCNDVRELKGMERAVSKELGVEWPVLVPPYGAGSLADLLAPISRCRTVLTSRYHGALAAAWLGCRVAVVARNSRVATVARELGVPCVSPPLSETALAEAVGSACVVERPRLEAMGRAALDGVAFALGLTA